MATLVVVAACANKERTADSTLPLDTIKSAPRDTVARADTTRAAASTPVAGSTKSTTTTKTTATTTTTTTKTTTTPAARDSNLGRDSVIRFPLNDPSRRIPVVKKDTARPPR